MDLSYTPAELEFREEVRTFIRDRLPEPIRAKAALSPHYDREDVRTWHRILNEKGWAASHWPVEYGGPGWSAVQRYIFMEELLQAPAPEPLSFNINMVGPVIYTFGTAEQKEHFLPKIRNLDYWFCQGFSEPGAGSDLAALRTSAVRDGDHYVINGQKMWTSTAHEADWMFCLARTDPSAKKQEGISFILIDMKTPGITVRPIITIDGAHHTNEVFFDNVRVPVAIASVRKTRAGIMQSFCSATNGLALPGLAFPRAASSGPAVWQSCRRRLTASCRTMPSSAAGASSWKSS